MIRVVVWKTPVIWVWVILLIGSAPLSTIWTRVVQRFLLEEYDSVVADWLHLALTWRRSINKSLGNTAYWLRTTRITQHCIPIIYILYVQVTMFSQPYRLSPDTKKCVNNCHSFAYSPRRPSLSQQSSLQIGGWIVQFKNWPHSDSAPDAGPFSRWGLAWSMDRGNGERERERPKLGTPRRSVFFQMRYTK